LETLYHVFLNHFFTETISVSRDSMGYVKKNYNSNKICFFNVC